MCYVQFTRIRTPFGKGLIWFCYHGCIPLGRRLFVFYLRWIHQYSRGKFIYLPVVPYVTVNDIKRIIAAYVPKGDLILKTQHLLLRRDQVNRKRQVSVSTKCIMLVCVNVTIKSYMRMGDLLQWFTIIPHLKH